MQIRCWSELEAYGALDIMRREYGNLLSATPEPEYNVSLEIDLANIPPEGGTFDPSVVVTRICSHSLLT